MNMETIKKFPDGARVCFVGDSITHCNRFVARIAGFYRDHFPEAKVEFYNCGISGATLGTILSFFDRDVLPFEPTHIVLMIGVNDAHRTHLEKKSPNRFDKMRAAFDCYQSRLKILCERIEQIHAELIICTPAPYDEYHESEIPSLQGGAAMMLGYAEYLKVFAKENGYPLCDYHSYITRELTLSTEPLYTPDHVHLKSLGHYHIAKCFLAFQGLEISEDKDIPASVLPWHEVTLKLRDTVATESFLLKENEYSQSDEYKINAILNFINEPNGGSNEEYFLRLANAYAENKKNQAKNIEFVKAFMKS